MYGSTKLKKNTSILKKDVKPNNGNEFLFPHIRPSQRNVVARLKEPPKQLNPRHLKVVHQLNTTFRNLFNAASFLSSSYIHLFFAFGGADNSVDTTTPYPLPIFTFSLHVWLDKRGTLMWFGLSFLLS